VRNGVGEGVMEERIVKADPVGDPAGYQREMVALLGGQDPLDVLASTVSAVRELTAAVPDEVLNRRPEPDEWSAFEVLGHIWDAEVAFSWRSRLILAQDRPTLTGYDQVAWAALARPDFATLLDAFEAMRGPNLLMLRAVKDDDWRRVGQHTERGEVNLRLLVETSAGHDRAHVKQIEQTLAAVR
jgi:DinB family protein